MTACTMVATDEALRVANARIAQLQRKAANQRLAGARRPRRTLASAVRLAGARRPRRTLASAVRLALSSLRAAVATIDAGPGLPRLADYPYRS